MRKYDDEFKRNVVRKVLDGQSVSSVSREIGVNESLIHKWKRAALDNGDGIKSGAEIAEAAALKKRIRELEQENEILKSTRMVPYLSPRRKAKSSTPRTVTGSFVKPELCLMRLNKVSPLICKPI